MRLIWGMSSCGRRLPDNDYRARGCDIDADEIFISDGAKCDTGNIQEIFSLDNRVAVCDPVYPVYVDSNVMAGRTGTYDSERETWSDVIYMPCTAENRFAPELPGESRTPDLIYLCFPNNPTGSTINKAQLQEWVDYANKNGSVIIYDAAYEAYISEEDVPHTIYECEGARTCAIELRSFSKNAGFTGVRLGFTVIPKDLKCGDVSLHALWARRHGTKYNGAPYIIQRAGRGGLQRGRKDRDERAGRLLYEECGLYSGWIEVGRVPSLRRRQCALYLAESAKRHDELGVFRLSA